MGCYYISITCVPEFTESSQLLYLITCVLFPPDVYTKKRGVLWLKPLEEALQFLQALNGKDKR